MSQPTKRQIETALQQANTQGQGVLQVTFVWREDVVGLMADALAGSEEAFRAFQLASKTLKQIPGSRSLCMLCDAEPEITQIGMVAGIHAAIDAPQNLLAFVVCTACSNRPRSAVMKAVRKKILGGFTGLRPLDVHPGSGTA